MADPAVPDPVAVPDPTGPTDPADRHRAAQLCPLLDELDLLVAEAMLLHGLGAHVGGMQVRLGSGQAVVELTGRARRALTEAAAGPHPRDDGWLGLLAAGLSERTVDAVGWLWRDEVEVAVEAVAAERAAGMAGFARASAAGSVTVDLTRRAVDVVAARLFAPAALAPAG